MIDNLIVFASVAAAALYLANKYLPAALKMRLAGALAEFGPQAIRAGALRARDRFAAKAAGPACDDCSGCAETAAQPATSAEGPARVIEIRKEPGARA